MTVRSTSRSCAAIARMVRDRSGADARATTIAVTREDIGPMLDAAVTGVGIDSGKPVIRRRAMRGAR
ncbi:hypothetical protein GCM10011490_14850 [Pseudoclavibacter endophyticus]|nr:hypothetical protein GCM10011490_14850 [Pseudoclavibacter endophyticus]